VGYEVTVYDFYIPDLTLEQAQALTDRYWWLFRDEYPLLEISMKDSETLEVQHTILWKNCDDWYEDLKQFCKDAAALTGKTAYFVFIGESGDIMGFRFNPDGTEYEPTICWEVVENEKA